MFSGWDFTKFEEPSFSVGVEEGVSQIIPIVLWDFEGLVAYALVQFLCVERVKWNPTIKWIAGEYKIWSWASCNPLTASTDLWVEDWHERTWMFSCLCVFQFHISGDYEIQVLLSRGGKELCGFTFCYKYCNK